MATSRHIARELTKHRKTSTIRVIPYGPGSTDDVKRGEVYVSTDNRGRYWVEQFTGKEYELISLEPYGSKQKAIAVAKAAKLELARERRRTR